ncbi:MAG: lysylphosphatidylglycerol synthase domain-containing protein [Anaerolineae bacterium]
MGRRSKLLYHPNHAGLSIPRLAGILLIGQMLNIVVPARAGEMARIYFMGRTENRSRALTLGTIVIEKWLDILMVLILLLFMPAIVALPAWFQDSRAGLATFAGAFFGTALVLSYGKSQLMSLVERLASLLPPDWQDRTRRGVSLALTSLDVLRSPRVGLQLQLWSFLIWSLSILVNFFTFKALGIDLSLTAALFLLAVLQVGVAVPSAPGKLGVFHYLCILALGFFGIDKTTSLGYSVLLYFVVFFPPTILGALGLWWHTTGQKMEGGERKREKGRWEKRAPTMRKTGTYFHSPPSMISIVIPAHNAAHTIAAGLQALHNQTLPRHQYEIIVVDDGSTDGTAEVVEQSLQRQELTAAAPNTASPTNPATVDGQRPVVSPAEPSTVARLIQQPHCGAAAARNAGAQAARGDVIVFLDADCVPAVDWLERLVSPMSMDGVVGTGGRVETRQQGVLPRFIQLEYDERYDRVARHRCVDFISSATAAYRRNGFQKIGGFDTTMLGAEDVDLSFRLAEAGHKLVFAPDAIVYHTHPQSLWAYIRRKFKYARWRATVYGRHPGKVAGDSRTPQTQKLQIVVAPIIGLSLALSLVEVIMGGLAWRALLIVAGAAIGIFLASTTKFVRRAWQLDPVIGLVSPVFLFVSAAAAAAGLATGIPHRQFIQRVLASVRS